MAPIKSQNSNMLLAFLTLLGVKLVRDWVVSDWVLNFIFPNLIYFSVPKDFFR